MRLRPQTRTICHGNLWHGHQLLFSHLTNSAAVIVFLKYERVTVGRIVYHWHDVGLLKRYVDYLVAQRLLHSVWVIEGILRNSEPL